MFSGKHVIPFYMNFGIIINIMLCAPKKAIEPKLPCKSGLECSCRAVVDLYC